MIAIIDYGAGNLHSVVNAMKYIGCDVKIVQTGEEMSNTDGAILPGVGAFGDAMRCLNESRLIRSIDSYLSTGKPFLGICVGLQMLFEESEESSGVPGLGIFKGKIRKIPTADGRKVPHVGWNSLNFTNKTLLFQGISHSAYVYFVHSYYLDSAQRDIVTAQTQYGVSIDAAVCKGNLFATQFHPEKSGEVGIRILKNYKSIVEGR